MSIQRRLRPALARANRELLAWGVDGRKAVVAARGFAAVRAERREYERQRRASRNPDDFPIAAGYPILTDRFGTAGDTAGHYFLQDLLVAREVFRRRPQRHVDVGSSITGLVSHIAAFREIEVLDIRPLGSVVSGITFVQQDVMSLDPAFHDYADSVSCLSVLEHFGLGRYGDPVDYDGWRKGLDGLTRMLRPSGVLYLAVPTSSAQRVEFNAHRVFSIPFLRAHLTAAFEVEELAFITDASELVRNVDPQGADAERGLGSRYGSSIWILRKR